MTAIDYVAQAAEVIREFIVEATRRPREHR